MNLQVSVVLLFISLTGGYSLKCFSCPSVAGNSCKAKEQTCAAGETKCFSSTVETSTGTSLSKGCSSNCESGTVQLATGGTETLKCCVSDFCNAAGIALCNAADGVYKGSFLLLVSPLLFYFLFQ